MIRPPRPVATLAGLALLALLPASLGADRPDLVVADFEGDDFAGWVATGTAFGDRPARGTLPGQMAVSGFEGKGLASSFVGGDDAEGTLTSPPFRVERAYLNYRIGGGKFPGETCLELLVDGSTVRSATGPNDKPGGSEWLVWTSWDVAEFAGKMAVVRVVDRRKGGWGHISVDQVVQSDDRVANFPVVRSFAGPGRFLHLPVRADAPARRFWVQAGGRVPRVFEIKLAEPGPADFVAFLDLAPIGEGPVVVGAPAAGWKALGGITRAATLPDEGNLYREPGRPQFHFTSRRGWLNDPNGLVWLDGEYHLFYQHNPYGWDWGNMHWGHAVSPDLVRWRELPIALYPREFGDWAFSGSAVVDRARTSGFGPEGSTPLVLAYTSTGRGECIASSLDRGRTWSEFAGNPVVRHAGRDPRLLWHGPTGRWVMAVYDEEKGERSIAFHSSPDLKAWTYESKIGGFFECPDLFELPVEGQPGRKLWVLSAADGEYLLGHFDGRKFEPEPGGKRRTWHGHFYAAQTFSDAPDGRRVQVGWARGIAFPGMPFNQQMTTPCELTLRPTEDGVRLFARPVAELATLRSRSRNWKGPVVLPPGEVPLSGLVGDLFDVAIEAEVGPSGGFTLTALGLPVAYDAARRTIAIAGTSAPLAPGPDGVVRLRVLVDRGSIEAYGNDGRVAISQALAPAPGARPLSLSTRGDGTKIRSIEAHELKSAWPTGSR